MALPTACGNRKPATYGLTVRLLLVDDGLHLLVERQHQRVLGNVAVDLLPAGDALGFSSFSPHSGPIIASTSLDFQRRVRARAEHREAGRVVRVADRVAPVVERHRRELVAQAQLEVLGDLVDLDLGLDADLAPHADDGLHRLVVLRQVAARGLDLELAPAWPGCSRTWPAAVLASSGSYLTLMRRVEGRVLRRLQGVDDHAIAAQQALDDRLLVDRVHRGLAHVVVGHRLDVGDEEHRDVGDRRAHAGQVRVASSSGRTPRTESPSVMSDLPLSISATRALGSVTNLIVTLLKAGFGAPVLVEGLELDVRTLRRTRRPCTGPSRSAASRSRPRRPSRSTAAGSCSRSGRPST